MNFHFLSLSFRFTHSDPDNLNFSDLDIMDGNVFGIGLISSSVDTLRESCTYLHFD
jgi:hypothetical protein